MSGFEANGEEEEENNEGEEDRVLEWEMGLPNADDLTPLSQVLIPPELASAFSISPEPSRTARDVDRASQTTLSSLRGGSGQLSSNNNFKPFNGGERAPMVAAAAAEEENNAADRDGMGSPRKLRKIDSEEADSGLRTENSGDDPSAAAAARTSSKRPRLVWTPQLHKRFVDVVAHLGIKNAVPKTIMQMMNVEGLTRENVASHLQKYRLYLKRMQGLSTEGPSSSDQLFASTPVPQNLHESGATGSGGGGNGAVHGNGHLGVPIPVPYHLAGGIMPMPVYGHVGMQMGNSNHHHYPQINHHNHHHHHHHHGFDGNGPFVFQQRDWTGSNYGSVFSYPHHPHQVAPNDNL